MRCNKAGCASGSRRQRCPWLNKRPLPSPAQGFCVRGDACGFAHGVFEVHLHPSRYRTQLCKDGPGCHRPVCFFAHRLDELRTPTHTWMPGAEELAAAGVAMPPGTVAGVGGGGGGGEGFRASSLAHSAAAHVAFTTGPRNSGCDSPVSLADPRVIHRPASSTGSTPSPPPPPPYRASDEDRVLHSGGDREDGGTAPVSGASSAAAAAAVMPYDDLLCES